MKELNVKTLRKKEKQGFVKKVNLSWRVNYSRGEHEDEFKASRGKEYQRQLATNLSWRVHGELTFHGEQNYSRGEVRRPNPSKLTWQKPTGEESSTRHGEQITFHGEFIKFCKYKRPICSFQWGDIISYQIIIFRPLQGEKNRGKPEITSRNKELQGLERTCKIIETSWLGYSFSLLLLVRLP